MSEAGLVWMQLCLPCQPQAVPLEPCWLVMARLTKGPYSSGAQPQWPFCCVSWDILMCHVNSAAKPGNRLSSLIHFFFLTSQIWDKWHLPQITEQTSKKCFPPLLPMSPTLCHTYCQGTRSRMVHIVHCHLTNRKAKRMETSLGDIFTFCEALPAELNVQEKIGTITNRTLIWLWDQHHGLFETILVNQCGTNTRDLKTFFSPSSNLIVF